MAVASGTFEIDKWEESALDENEGAKLTRARVTKTFRGDVSGHSVAEVLLAVAHDKARAYVGFERIAAQVHGRSGTFVLQHVAVDTPVEGFAHWTVLSDSGTGELVGLRGKARISGEPGTAHTFELEYELDGRA